MRERGDVRETSRDTERVTSQVQAVSGCAGVSFLSVCACVYACLFVCACAVAATGCSIGRKGDEAVWQLRTDNDEDYNDDVIGPLVVAGFWWQSV